MVKILVDSASDVVENEAKTLGVEFLPIEIRFRDEEFYDGLNLTHEEFFAKLAECEELPKTSQINEYRFEQAFEKMTADGSEAVAIVISSKLSGTYLNACRAAEKFCGKVRVVDSLNASAGQKILCKYALRLAANGLSAEEIAAELDEKKRKVHFFAVLDTLKYLKMGGRISPLVAVTGGLLSVKPLIAVVDGEIKSAGKAIGNKRANKMLTERVDELGGIDFSMPFSFVYSGPDDSLLKAYLKENPHLTENAEGEIEYHLLGSTVGTHIGPGAIGLSFFEK